MTHNTLIKKLVEKCKILFPEGYHHSATVELKIYAKYDQKSSYCKYNVFFHAMGNEKITMRETDEGYKESMYLSINADTLKQAFNKINDEIDKVSKTEKIDLE